LLFCGKTTLGDIKRRWPPQLVEEGLVAPPPLFCPPPFPTLQALCGLDGATRNFLHGLSSRRIEEDYAGLVLGCILRARLHLAGPNAVQAVPVRARAAHVWYRRQPAQAIPFGRRTVRRP